MTMSHRDEVRESVTKPDEGFVTRDQIFARLLAYARARWCWDDETMLAELYEQDAGDKTVEATVDAWADHYDLTDPRELGL